MIDSRQFILSRKSYTENNFCSILLDDGYYFSYHKDTCYYLNSNRNVLLVGYAWLVDKENGSVEEEIERLTKDYGREELVSELLKRELYWCGKYLLVVNGFVYLDATGLLGLYYSNEGISNSCALLAKISGEKTIIYRHDNCTINWLPSPRTHHEGIKKLLPSQVYNINSKTVSSRPLLTEIELNYSDENELVQVFVESFVTSLTNLKKKFSHSEIMIPLTGGHDSRTVLALAHKAGLEYTCFTLEHDNMSDEDRIISQKICEGENIPYVFIPRNREAISKNREREYELHTDGLADDEDKRFYSYGQYKDLIHGKTDVVLLRGHVWESVIEYYRDYISEELPDEVMYERFGGYSSELIMESLIEYSDWIKNHEENSLKKADRFLWEQRVGGWMSAIEQGFDLMDGIISLHPVNSRYFLSMLLCFPRNERLTKQHQERIIAYCWKELAKYDYDGNKKKRKDVKLLINVVKRIKIMGARKAVNYYKYRIHHYIGN